MQPEQPQPVSQPVPQAFPEQPSQAPAQPQYAQPTQPEQLPVDPSRYVQRPISQPPQEITTEVLEPTPQTGEIEPVQWQAPEYVQEHRSPWWFVGFWAAAALLMIAAAFLFKSWSFALLVPAMAAALMVYSHRPPRILNYVASAKGVYINEKLHSLSEFRSFGILDDESIPSIMFIPVKRFRPGLTIHFPPEIGERVVDLFGSHIPMQELKPDVFDRLIRKLHI